MPENVFLNSCGFRKTFPGISAMRFREFAGVHVFSSSVHVFPNVRCVFPVFKCFQVFMCFQNVLRVSQCSCVFRCSSWTFVVDVMCYVAPMRCIYFDTMLSFVAVFVAPSLSFWIAGRQWLTKQSSGLISWAFLFAPHCNFSSHDCEYGWETFCSSIDPLPMASVLHGIHVCVEAWLHYNIPFDDHSPTELICSALLWDQHMNWHFARTGVELHTSAKILGW